MVQKLTKVDLLKGYFQVLRSFEISIFWHARQLPLVHGHGFWPPNASAIFQRLMNCVLWDYTKLCTWMMMMFILTQSPALVRKGVQLTICAL